MDADNMTQFMDQVSRLMRYASEQGLDPGGKLLPQLNDAFVAYQNAEESEKLQCQSAVFKHYTALAARTAGEHQKVGGIACSWVRSWMNFAHIPPTYKSINIRLCYVPYSN